MKKKLNTNFVLGIQNIEFTKPGKYSADITVDNHFLKSVTLTQVQKPQQPI